METTITKDQLVKAHLMKVDGDNEMASEIIKKATTLLQQQQETLEQKFEEEGILAMPVETRVHNEKEWTILTFVDEKAAIITVSQGFRFNARMLRAKLEDFIYLRVKFEMHGNEKDFGFYNQHLNVLDTMKSIQSDFSDTDTWIQLVPLEWNDNKPCFKILSTIKLKKNRIEDVIGIVKKWSNLATK